MTNDAKAAAEKPCAQKKYATPRIAFEGDEAGNTLALEGDEVAHTLTISGDVAEVSTDGL